MGCWHVFAQAAEVAGLVPGPILIPHSLPTPVQPVKVKRPAAVAQAAAGDEGVYPAAQVAETRPYSNAAVSR